MITGTYPRLAAREQRRVGDVIQTQPKSNKIQSREYLAMGAIPVIDQGASFVAGYVNDDHKKYTGSLPAIIFGDHTCCLKYVDFDFAVGADGTQIFCASPGIYTKYLFYALHTVDLAQFGYQRHFKLLKDCEVTIPGLTEQLRIASILGAYDDLIEVNRRRIAVLEATARDLFEEWFVRFRLPGHEGVEIVETPEGPLPRGWVASELGGLLQLQYGRALKADTRVDGSVPVLGSSGIVGSHNAYFVEGPAIIVGRKGNVGSIIWCSQNCWPIDTVFYVSSDKPLTFLYELLKLVPFQNTDAAVPGINRTAALKKRVISPPEKLIYDFDEIARPMRELRQTLDVVNSNLAAARDLLLPRLISGELSVAAAERELENAA